MPSNAKGIDYQFIRRALAGSASWPAAGTLKLSGIPRDLWYRKLFVGVVFSGFSDWSAVAEIRVLDQDRELLALREQFGTAANSYGASSTTWGASTNSDRDGLSGFPPFSVRTLDVAGEPNRGPVVAPEGAISFQSVYTPGSALAKMGSICTMLPFPLVGRMTDVLFRFVSSSVNVTEATPLVEVYLGMLSASAH